MLLGLKAFFVGALWVSFSLPASAQIPAYDLVLRNARTVDGNGGPAYRGDGALRGDAIVQIASSRLSRIRLPPRVSDGKSLSCGLTYARQHL